MKSLRVMLSVLVACALGAAAQAASFEEMVNAEPPMAAVGGEQGRKLAARLEAHVAQYITQKNWAPLFARMGEAGAFAIFDEQRVDVQALSAALPCLSPDLTAKVKAYLADELGRRLLVDEASRPAAGPRREYFLPLDGSTPVPGTKVVYRGEGFGATAAMYALWLYGARTADWQRVQEQWNKSADQALVSPKKPSLRQSGDYLAGLIGAARLARRFNDQQRYAAIITQGQTVADALVQQFNADIDRQLAVGSGFMSQARINWIYRAAIQRTYIEPLPILTPEVATLMRDGSADRIAKSFDIIDRWYPSWWIAWGERIGGSSGYDQEDETILPTQAMAIYSFQALARKTEPQKLAMWTDVAWCRADAYYVMKLVMAIEASAR